MSAIDDLPPAPPAKKPRGCLFWLGITAILAVLVFGIGGYFLVRWGFDQLATAIETYSDPEPMPLPESTMSAEAYQDLAARVDAFADGAGDPTLALSADDVNALIARHPAWSAWRGRLHVDMAGDTMTARVAFPLDAVAESFWRMERLVGRFLNATVTLQPSRSGGQTRIRLVDVELEGRQLPAEFRAELKNQGRIDQAVEPYLGELPAKVQAFRVEDGKLVVQRAGA